MAYSRWIDSKWYIYWLAGYSGEDVVVVYNRDVDDAFCMFSVSEVKRMLSKNDFSRVVGFDEPECVFLGKVFSEWVRDVERERSGGDV